MQFITPTKKIVAKTPTTELQFDCTTYPMPTFTSLLQQETTCNEGAAPFEHEAVDKANGCETNSFNLSQYSDYVCDFEVEDTDDLSEFPTLNDKDDIDLDKEVIDPLISQFFKDYLSQTFPEDVILTQDLASQVD